MVLLKEEFQTAWESLSVDKKLIWFIFVNKTIAVITLIEYLLLKR